MPSRPMFAAGRRGRDALTAARDDGVTRTQVTGRAGLLTVGHRGGWVTGIGAADATSVEVTVVEPDAER